MIDKSSFIEIYVHNEFDSNALYFLSCLSTCSKKMYVTIESNLDMRYLDKENSANTT